MSLLGAQLSVAMLLPSSAMQSIAVNAAKALLLPCCFDSIAVGAQPLPMLVLLSRSSLPCCCCCWSCSSVVGVHLLPAEAAAWLLPLLVMLMVPVGAYASQAAPALLLRVMGTARGSLCCTKLPGTKV
jgi:hypothetical protein